ncbi:MAG: glycosyltransferase family 2 protein [Chloroflexi bacterium]|nr:glycosyltransferase family 2 protein [Chloroflexota bacterium]
MNLSIVVPVYNEAENLPLLVDAIHAALDDLPITWEMVFVDDGSKDGSLEALEELAEKNLERMRVVVLRRNFGQTTAIAAGIDHAQGEVIVLLDADMQNDPADIPAMLDKIDQGYDVVSGWRLDRKDTFLTRTLPSRIANGLISWVTGVHLHDYGCTLKAYRREVITGFRLYGEMHRFIPAYANSVGAKITEMPVHHHPRRYGKAKYGLERTLKVILDLLTVKYLMTFANKPIYLFGGAGSILILGSMLTLIYLVVRRLIYPADPEMHLIRSPLLLMAMMLFTMGFQSILLGLIAELLARTYHESQHKPTYTVRRVIHAAAFTPGVQPEYAHPSATSPAPQIER